jgi:hypothetical protein
VAAVDPNEQIAVTTKAARLFMMVINFTQQLRYNKPIVRSVFVLERETNQIKYSGHYNRKWKTVADENVIGSRVARMNLGNRDVGVWS